MKKSLALLLVLSVIISVAATMQVTAATFASPVSPVPAECPFPENTLSRAVCCDGKPFGASIELDAFCSLGLDGDDVPPPPLSPIPTPTPETPFCIGLTSGYVLCY